MKAKRAAPNLPSQADADLLALVRKFCAEARRRAALAQELDEALSGGASRAVIEGIERRRNPVLDRRDALYGRIGRTAALTASGVLAKLSVVAEELSDMPGGMDGFEDDGAPNYVLASAVADALALSARGHREQAQLAVIREALGLAT